MTASIETKRVVNALKGALRWAGLAESRPFACLSGRALVTTADLALTQMGVPAALACCQYLAVDGGAAHVAGPADRGPRTFRVTSGPAPDTATRDHERR